MLETSARLLRLLALLQTRRDWNGPQLARELGVTTRTIRKDVERLRALGYPVDASPGVAGGCASNTSRTRAATPGAAPSRIGWSTPAAAGTSSPGTSSTPTGAHSEQTE